MKKNKIKEDIINNSKKKPKLKSEDIPGIFDKKEKLKINEFQIRTYVNIDDFIKYHKRIVKYLCKLHKKEPRLSWGICFLGIESIAKIKYPKEKSGKRIILLLKKYFSKREAEFINAFYRNNFVHQGMLNPYIDSMIEDNEEGNTETLCYLDKKSLDQIPDLPYYTVGCFVGIYYQEIINLKEYFKKRKIKNRIIWNFDYRDSKLKK